MDIHGNHHLQQQQQQQQPQPQPQPPPPTHKSLVDQDVKRRPLVPVSFPNGTLKKHRPLYPPPPPGQHPGNGGSHVVYRECMKNHAASLGGHALDGCGEFMPSPDASPADPASLTCAACGCHRNFHRRVLHGAGAAEHQQHLYHPQREEREVDDRAGEEEDGDEAVDEEEGEEGHGSPRPQQSQPAPHQFYSAPHMLMALSAGGPVGASGPLPVAVGAATTPPMGCSLLPRKRFRSKFSQEQKDRMHELSERLGWRMQKRDDALVEDCCREIGVTRGVFKVWMHNNKHNFVGGPSSRRASGGVGAAAGGGGGGGVATSSNGGGGVVGVGLGITTAARVNGGDERNGVGSNGGGGSGSGNHVMNGSSSPSS